MTLFERCLEIILRNEGKYSNDPDDSGKETYKGISRRYWPDWDGWVIIDQLRDQVNFPEVLEQNIFIQEFVSEFYKDNFWDIMNLDLLNNENSILQIFDFGVNAGYQTSIKLAQRSANEIVDGVLGVNTASKINALGTKFIDLFIEERISYYNERVKKRPVNAKYIKGWIKRATTTKF